MAKTCFIQYHNCGKLQCWPRVYKDEGERPDWGGIFTKKALPLIGDRVYLIAGVKQEGRPSNDYYLWEYIEVKECVKEDGLLVYRGPQHPCKCPIYLNDVPGFDELKNAAADFSTGLQDRSKMAISDFICDDGKYVSLADLDDCIEWQCAFEEKYITDEYWRDTMRDENGSAIEIPAEEE